LVLAHAQVQTPDRRPPEKRSGFLFKVIKMEIPKKLKQSMIKEELIAITGNWILAIILNQFIQWTYALTDNWIQKSAKQINDTIMFDFSDVTIRSYIKNLVNRGYLEERNNPECVNDRTKQYRVNMLKVIGDLSHLGYSLDRQ
jgi:hypothetical protein